MATDNITVPIIVSIAYNLPKTLYAKYTIGILYTINCKPIGKSII